MADQDPLADMITLFSAPIAGAVRSVEQFRTGVDEFLRGIENFNRTMENLNETAERINGLLEEVEEPVKAALPQITRAVRTADEVMQVVSGPAMAAAPGLAQFADTMSTPAFQQLPNQLGQFSQMLSEMSTRMAPLTQLAESAGGLFGLRLPGSSAAPKKPAETEPRGSEHRGIDAKVTRRAGPKTSTAGRSTTDTSAGAKKAATKSATRKSAAKKSAAKKSAARKSSAASKSERAR
jgi:hypothetical protein